jgi:hypothetical protein
MPPASHLKKKTDPVPTCIFKSWMMDKVQKLNNPNYYVRTCKQHTEKRSSNRTFKNVKNINPVQEDT